MILRFVWDPWVLVILLLVLGGFGVWGLVRATRDDDGTRVAWWRRLGLVLATVAIGATPAVVASSEQVTSNLEVFVVVDRTGSMAAEDWNGGLPRLDGVRGDVTALTEVFPAAHWSIIGFDSQATRQLPLTTDARAVVSWADTLRQELTFYSAGSAIDRPAETLATALAAAAERNPANVRLVFFLSDGENTDGDLSSPDASVEPYRPLAGLVDGGAVLGYGTAEGGRMRVNDGTANPNQPWIQDTTQSPPVDAVSRIDEGNLGDLASALGIGYLHRTAPGGLEPLADGVDVETIVEDGRTTVDIHRDVYWPFVWIVVALLAWEAFDQARGLRELRGVRVART